MAIKPALLYAMTLESGKVENQRCLEAKIKNGPGCKSAFKMLSTKWATGAERGHHGEKADWEGVKVLCAAATSAVCQIEGQIEFKKQKKRKRWQSMRVWGKKKSGKKGSQN